MSDWLKRSRQVMAQGETGCNSKRPSHYVEGIYPTHLVSGQDCYVTDSEGKKYIDFVGGLGTLSLGYNNPKVNEAIMRQVKKGISSCSLPHVLEVEVAEMICHTFALEKVRFLKTGNEATSAAVRIARAYNDRDCITIDGYHGHGDFWTALTPPAKGVKDVFCAYKNDQFESIEPAAAYIFEGLTISDSQLAVNQIKSNIGLHRVHDTLIISDEIVTGCRVENFTANQKFNYEADMVCLGKGIANGMPLAVVGGKAKIMDGQDYFISSTFSGEVLSLAACKATLEEIKNRSLKDLEFYAKRFMGNLNDIVKALGFQISGYGTRGMLPTTELECALFMQECCKAGVLFGKAFFYNFSHMEVTGVEQMVLSIANDVTGKILRGEVKLEGNIPNPNFKR